MYLFIQHVVFVISINLRNTALIPPILALLKYSVDDILCPGCGQFRGLTNRSVQSKHFKSGMPHLSIWNWFLNLKCAGDY